MPRPPKIEQGADAPHPQWLAFWGIVYEEARRLDALEESRTASAGKP